METDRAFSQCTECKFEYQMETPAIVHSQARLSLKYAIMVSRDICGVTIFVQLIICLFALVASWMDSDRNLPSIINEKYPMAVYYMCGVVALLMILGIFGDLLLCMKGFVVQDILNSHPTVRPLGRRGSDEEYNILQPSYFERSASYHARREQRRRQIQQRGERCDYCCHGCIYTSNPGNDYYSDSRACFWCCNDDSLALAQESNSSRGNSDNECYKICCIGVNCLGSAPSCGRCGEIACLFVVAMLVFMVTGGFILGLILIVVILQRSLQRHLYILKKRQLVDEFRVKDLSTCDDLESQQNVQANSLSEKDSNYLQALGLMEPPHQRNEIYFNII